MKRIALFGLLAALLLGGLLFANHRRQQTPAYLLGHHSRSDTLDLITENHLRPAPLMLFQSDWFPDDTTGTAQGCKIARTGSEICESYAATISGAVGLSSLSPATLSRLQSALRALPSGETVAPPLNQLLIVSFRDGQRWTTRIYNRAHPPAQLVRLAQIAGFRGLNLQPA